ncbi:STAS domain-containing protein [Micromonospora taraxaci]|uniref:Anti-anti-sigma factor n=1 Tax=Micromonospora taraxaci TaxID=1316803 RepID=A0A561W510_9ACTN|nr:STAS domain-containing protein [Micromonospora taraxaci]TWG18923.1 anti-anti-sigma factor [Micromonospora taraxaci]
MSTTLTLTTDQRPDGALVLTAIGEVDMSNAADFGDALTRAVDAAPGPLTVDLTALEYLDSAGLAVLFPHVERIHLIASPILAPVLIIAGLADLMTVTPA